MSDFDSKKALDKLGAFARDSAGSLQDKAAEIRKKKNKAAQDLLRPEEIVDMFALYGRKLTEMDHPVEEAVLYYKQGDRCLKNASSADLTHIEYDDILDCTHFSIPEKDWLLGEKDMRAMILAKPAYIGMCLAIQRPIEAVLDDMAMIIGQNVLIAPREKKAIGKALRGRFAVMIEDQNVLVVGRTFYEAFTALTVLEKAAELFLKADVLGGGIPVPPVRAALEHRVYTMKYSKAEESHKLRETSAQSDAAGNADDAPSAAVCKPDEMTEDEWTKRCLLVEYGKKMLETGLVQGTWGNLSVRLDDEYMLVTPSGLDYNRLSPLDEVKVEIATGEYEGDLKPTSETAFHCGLYAMRPDVGAILHTHSKYCAVFAAAHMPLEIEDPALAEVFGTDLLPIAEYGLSGTKMLAKNILKVMETAPGCLMRNHGMIAVGKDIEHAFERCLKMEQAAEAGVERRWKALLEGDDEEEE